MELSLEQENCIKAIIQWRRSKAKPWFLVAGPAGCGKQQPVDCLVQTPIGPVPIGKLSVGDKVFGLDGKPTTVVGVFPQGIQQAYKISFRDGFSTECGIDHLWTIDTTKIRKTVTTRELLSKPLRDSNNDCKFRVPLCNQVDYPEAILPIPPYFLGALIGDGTNLGKTPVLCCPDYEIADKCKSLVPEFEYKIDLSSNCPRHKFMLPDNRRLKRPNPLGIKFTDLGLNVKSPQRFIPEIYLRGSITQRIELLRGLMDTDGTCCKNRCSFSTKSERLMNDLCALVQSLGGIAIRRKQVRKGRGIDGTDGIEYGVNVKTFFNPFSLWWKAAEWKPTWKNPPSRSITDIQPSRICEQVCIQVDNEDGLYLTDHYITTHNTELVKRVLETVKGEVILAGPTGKSALIMSQRTKRPAQTIHSLIYKPAGTGGNREAIERMKEELKTLDEGSDRGRVLSRELKKLLSAVKPLFNLNLDSRLKDAALLVVDEMSMVPESVVQDLLSFNVPVLVQGDFYQLQPVMAKPFFKESDTDFKLTQVHRQAKDSPIIHLATLAREGKRISIGKYGDSVVTHDVSTEEAMEHEQIIVGKNKTRHATNAKVRNLLGRVSQMPEEGDKVMCLYNNAKAGLMNGQKFVVTSFDDIDKHRCILGVRGDDLDTRFVAHKEYFLEKEPDPWHRQAAENFCYSYAATCHKMQGDQADSVFVLDQSRCFPGQEKAWGYTAITRAQTRVTIKLTN